MNSDLFKRGSLEIARARESTHGSSDYPKLTEGERTVVIGDTGGRFGPSHHWDEQVIAAHRANGLALTSCLPTHLPTEHVDHVILARYAVANQSTIEDLEAWLSALCPLTDRISLVSVLPTGSALSRDEEEATTILLDETPVSITIRRDFYRQLQWEWFETQDPNQSLRWARCYRWYYPEELERLLTGLGQGSFVWRERSSSDTLARGVIELNSAN